MTLKVYPFLGGRSRVYYKPVKGALTVVEKEGAVARLITIHPNCPLFLRFHLPALGQAEVTSPE
jgi:hypothetical protein